MFTLHKDTREQSLKAPSIKKRAFVDNERPSLFINNVLDDSDESDTPLHKNNSGELKISMPEEIEARKKLS